LSGAVAQRRREESALAIFSGNATACRASKTSRHVRPRLYCRLSFQRKTPSILPPTDQPNANSAQHAPSSGRERSVISAARRASGQGELLRLASPALAITAGAAFHCCSALSEPNQSPASRFSALRDDHRPQRRRPVRRKRTRARRGDDAGQSDMNLSIGLVADGIDQAPMSTAAHRSRVAATAARPALDGAISIGGLRAPLPRRAHEVRLSSGRAPRSDAAGCYGESREGPSEHAGRVPSTAKSRRRRPLRCCSSSSAQLERARRRHLPPFCMHAASGCDRVKSSVPRDSCISTVHARHKGRSSAAASPRMPKNSWPIAKCRIGVARVRLYWRLSARARVRNPGSREPKYATAQLALRPLTRGRRSMRCVRRSLLSRRETRSSHKSWCCSRSRFRAAVSSWLLGAVIV